MRGEFAGKSRNSENFQFVTNRFEENIVKQLLFIFAENHKRIGRNGAKRKGSSRMVRRVVRTDKKTATETATKPVKKVVQFKVEAIRLLTFSNCTLLGFLNN